MTGVLSCALPIFAFRAARFPLAAEVVHARGFLGVDGLGVEREALRAEGELHLDHPPGLEGRRGVAGVDGARLGKVARQGTAGGARARLDAGERRRGPGATPTGAGRARGRRPWTRRPPARRRRPERRRVPPNGQTRGGRGRESSSSRKRAGSVGACGGGGLAGEGARGRGC